MLDSNVSQEFVGRIDESQRALISKMVSESTFELPSVASFTIGELTEDDTRTWTYSANSF